jgi:hypothetical protein
LSLKYFLEAKRGLVTFLVDPYALSTVYVKILCKGDSKRNMQDEPEKKKSDRARLAATKWLPMSAIGAAIPFVIGVVMQLPVQQVLVAAALTSTLVFSGLWMQSYGRERQYRSAA